MQLYSLKSKQRPGTKQGLIASKLRLPKKQLTIPRLELVVAQMVANLEDNIRNSLLNDHIREVYGLSDSNGIRSHNHLLCKHTLNHLVI